MNFCVNNSPLAGREGKFVTSRQIRDRLDRELQSNVALRVRDTDEDGIFEVMGRGELHLTILLENMRREGYELAVSKPRVVFHDEGGERHEPIEFVTADVEDQHQGAVMQALGERRADLVNMESDGMGRVRLDYKIPARGLIGFQNEFLNLTRGTGLISNIFDSYEPYKGEIEGRKNGVLISQDDGEAVTYSLGKLDDRGRMFVKAGDPLYEGMVIGIHSRDNDLVVNAVRGKQLTNFRVSGKEDAIKITPPIQLTLEYAVEFIADDELVEITPKSIRIRKRHLKEHERKKASRGGARRLGVAFFFFGARGGWLSELVSETKSDGIISTVVLLFSAPTSAIICMRRSSSAAGLPAIRSDAAASFSDASSSASALMMRARFSRIASACIAITCCIASGSSTSFISKRSTSMPHCVVELAMLSRSRWLILSRSCKTSSRSCWPMMLRRPVSASW